MIVPVLPAGEIIAKTDQAPETPEGSLEGDLVQIKTGDERSSHLLVLSTEEAMMLSSAQPSRLHPNG
jgi:hypothetical protein